jgi:hypothetical protein
MAEKSIGGGLGLRLFAVVPRELQFKMVGGSGHPLQKIDRHSKFLIAESADRDGRRGSNPLQHSEITFRHGQIHS